MSHFIDAEVVRLAHKKRSLRGSPLIAASTLSTGLNRIRQDIPVEDPTPSAMSGNAEPLRSVPFTQATVRIHSLKYGMDFTHRIDKGEVSKPTQIEIGSLPEFAEDTDTEAYFLRPASEEKSLTWITTPEIPGKAGHRWSAHRYMPTTESFM